MAKQFKSDTPTIEEIRRRKKPLSATIEISLDPDLTREMVALEAQIERAQSRSNIAQGAAGLAGARSLADLPDVEQLQADLDALWVRAREESAIQAFVFKDPGRKAYDDLVTACPPSDEQKQEWRDGGGDGSLAYDPDLFVPRLMALCATSPEMTEADAEALCDEWSTGDITKLFNGALSVCLGVAPVPKSPRLLTDTVEILSSEPN